MVTMINKLHNCQKVQKLECSKFKGKNINNNNNLSKIYLTKKDKAFFLFLDNYIHHN